ncbi:Sorbitol Dehydrogenase [Manis pentadactyla]|nr:Sorbitol Dehydrogenase [Manis pentadactyla]
MRIRVTLTPRFPPPVWFICGSGPVPMSCCVASAGFGLAFLVFVPLSLRCFSSASPASYKP